MQPPSRAGKAAEPPPQNTSSLEWHNEDAVEPDPVVRQGVRNEAELVLEERTRSASAHAARLEPMSALRSD